MSETEHYEDLFDWAKRWQATRIANTIATNKGDEHALNVIQQAAVLNRELDDILRHLGVNPWQPPVWDGSISGKFIKHQP